jgi:hypothetical protein
MMTARAVTAMTVAFITVIMKFISPALLGLTKAHVCNDAILMLTPIVALF